MAYMSVSFTHKNTDITVREKLSFSNDVRKKEILRLLASNSAIEECLVLSTCNRVEIFTAVDDFKVASKFVLLALSRVSGVSYDELAERADIYEDYGAIHHLFAVAASLDSLVVGETQIVGQLKDAFKFAKQNSHAGAQIARAIDEALKCAARIRNQTEISKNPISVSSVAVAMAKEKLGSLQGVNAVVVGAGEMSELACKHLLASGANITILNRNLAGARRLADSLISAESGANSENSADLNRADVNLNNASANCGVNLDVGADLNCAEAGSNGCEATNKISTTGSRASYDGSGGANLSDGANGYAARIKTDVLDNLKKYLNSASLFFSATGSQEPVITDTLLEPQGFKRYFFDIAVPRDVELSQSEDIEVYSVDDLEEIVKKNLLLREEQAQIAYSIVAKCTNEFFKWLRAAASTPIIKALRQSAKQVAELELAKALKKGYLKHSDAEEARKLIHQVFKAFLHAPTVNLKNLGEADDEGGTVNALVEIFELQENYEKFLNQENEKKDRQNEI
ncbi:glutamyl-tRNA reductase [uncultured Campylobacter sp.]|uniref:glutamyl-tRNA reductase n=1 Tax=uncultured Campylobacter sp. TaxID=218934 RepID=UPI002627C5DC|nr:glutamyl-tRNA reductase [uncultured Campylobacter sp.]